MQKAILMITITIQIPVPPMPPAPAGAEQPEPVFAKKQPPVCRCHVRYGNRAA
ncbi:hypothetical protein I5Q83_08895 [Enterocloster clostridioformis]|uniref:hypothetical protein n=1 Tax=Enterocloster clostridioformis TaxID=1531 RepID=UPI001408A039|nr:hypothetical protein [Enterocloster clostridioformis]QQR02373.1 hypothetical protein I5Q83_08895 [Enterocloster clostridioformis]